MFGIFAFKVKLYIEFNKTGKKVGVEDVEQFGLIFASSPNVK